MKKIMIGVVAMFCLWVVIGHAQPPAGGPPQVTPEKREKVEAMKVAFFTRKLDLTAEEAKVFWPVYNQYQDEMHKLRDGKRNEMREAKADAENLTDKDYERIFESEITFRQSEIDIMKKYQPQLRKTLPIKKLARIHRVEDEFKRELLEMIRDKKENKGGSSQRMKRN